MEVSDLLADTGADDVDECGRISPLGQSQSDAARPDAHTDPEVIPDGSNVPLFSRAVSAEQPDPQHANDETALGDSDPDIFMYVALCIGVVMVVLAFYTQVLKK